MAKSKKSRSVGGRLLDVLEEVDRPGEVCTWGDLALTMPGLEVDRLGPVRLPLGKTQAVKLIKLCRQAPYGKGTATVVDTKVRRVWELDPEAFRLINPKWKDLVDSLLEQTRQALGLEGHKLKADLHKLLLYEKGSFFLPHRDGEKLDRMVATLVVALPSKYQGGELIVAHEGRKQKIVFKGAASGLELSYAAFYADCEHEVRPVREGYRLCLTYNVTLAKKRGKHRIQAPSHGQAAEAVGQVLSAWQEHGGPEKLAVTLEHRYTQKGLTVDKLKGTDRARAEVLFTAADRAECEAHLALVTLWQCGNAEGGYDDYSYGYGPRYRRSDDEDEDEDDYDDYDETSADYEMGEVYESSLSADHWSDREGRKARLGEIRLDDDEIVAPEALDEGDPSREEFEGYTGNAGMTLERWYHRAAVVIWPRARRFDVLCTAGTDASIGGLEPMVGRLKRASKARAEALRGDCLAFASAIIDSWRPSRHYYGRMPGKDDGRNVFPELLCRLDDPDLVRRFLADVMPGDGTVQLGKSFVPFCKKHGWADFAEQLAALIDASSAETIARNGQLLRALCVARDKDPKRIALCRRLTERLVEAVKTLDSKPPRGSWEYSPTDRKTLLASLAAAMIAVDAGRPLKALVDHALSNDKYDLTEAHLAAIFSLKSQLAKRQGADSAARGWLAACRGLLQQRTAEAPRKPADFRRESKLPCRCADCRALSRFLDDPGQREARFPLPKERRGHLHNVIESNGCDCTHVTHRSGRPYVLVCTKTTASYERARRIHQRDLENLARLKELERKRGK